jgi:hypothetical protein
LGRTDNSLLGPVPDLSLFDPEKFITLDDQLIILHEIVLKINSTIMSVDGLQKEMLKGEMVAPININGGVFLPLRPVIEESGGGVEWDPTLNKVIISINSKKIELCSNNKKAVINGEVKMLSEAPQKIKGRVMIPLSYFSEIMGYKVKKLKNDIIINYY